MALLGFAQAQPTRPDTPAQTLHLLPAVQVAGSRPTRYAVGNRQLPLDSAAFSQYRSGTLAEALAARTPLYFKNYGPGQLASVSVRGTSARHTAVLWNGVNINFSSLGEADFSLLPVGGNTLATVQPGPGGALYGTGAVGGAVLLSGQPGFGGGWRGSAQADAGSFGLAAGSVEAGYGNEKLALRTTGLYRTAQNDFPVDRSGRVLQQNAAFTQWNFTQDARLRLGEGGQLSLAAWLTGTDRQIQPSLGAANRHGRETDHSTRLLAEYRQRHGRYEGAARVAFVHDGIVYGDDTLLPQASDLNTTHIQTDHTLTLNARTSLRLGGEAQHFAAAVDGYSRAASENRYAAFALFRYDPLTRLRLSANLRQAFVPDQRPPLAPTIGAEWDVLRPNLSTSAPQHLIALKASASRSYRAATLNERYWQPGGNPHLLPETGLGYELGLLHEYGQPESRWRWRTELTAYQQLVDNWVQWIPGAGGFYSPRNLRQVRTRGLEATALSEWHRPHYRAALRGSYAFTQARKTEGYASDSDPLGQQLAYVPLHAATLGTEHTWRGHWLLSATGSFSSYRYTTVSADDFLPGYWLVQGSVGRHFDWRRTRFTLLAQGYNLTNTRYQTYATRAMPPRSGVLSLRVAWR